MAKKIAIDWDILGELIDRIGSLNGAIESPLSDSIHLQGIRHNLPDIEARLKSFFVESAGENPWE